MEQALKLFEVTDILQETKETLNKKYKKLSKQYHPDAYHDDGSKFKEVKEAYDKLLDLLKQVQLIQILNRINVVEEKLLYISLAELFQIYEQGSITRNNETITKSDIRKSKTLVFISIDVLYKTNVMSFTQVNLWNVQDIYSISIELEDDNILEESSIDIKIVKENKHIDLKHQSTRFNASLPFNVKLSIDITKKLRKDT